MDYWEILEKKHAIKVLLTIYRNPGIIQDDFLKLEQEGSRAKYNRLKDLIQIGLIEEKPNEKHWNAVSYFTTNEGMRVAKLLSDVEDGSNEEKTNHSTPEEIQNSIKGVG